MASKNLHHLIKAPLRQLHHSLRAAYDLLRAQPRPLLVYQMGKVGSSSVCDALLAAGLRPLQVHVLGKKSAESRRRFAEQGLPLPYHKYVEQLLQVYLRLTKQRVKIITLVRDPIARVVSNSYQAGERYDRDTGDATAMVESLTKKLLQANALGYCYNWFDEEIREVFGMDIVVQAFDRERGHIQLSGQRAEVLVLKLERLDELWPVIGSFVGRDVAAKRSNIRSQSRDGETYQGVRAALSLPRDHVERLYDHPWMRHFYADQEVAAFIEQWSGPPELSRAPDTNDPI